MQVDGGITTRNDCHGDYFSHLVFSGLVNSSFPQVRHLQEIWVK